MPNLFIQGDGSSSQLRTMRLQNGAKEEAALRPNPSPDRKSAAPRSGGA